MTTYRTISCAAALAAALAIAAAPFAASAADTPAPAPAPAADNSVTTVKDLIIIGAIKAPGERAIENPADRSVPVLPVVYEDAKVPAKTDTKPQTAAAPTASVPAG